MKEPDVHGVIRAGDDTDLEVISPKTVMQSMRCFTENVWKREQYVKNRP